MAIDDNTNYTLTGAQVKDVATEVNKKVEYVDIEATTPVPAVETAMIADGAVTSAKIDWMTIGTVLYNTYNGTTPINLSDSIANYRYIDVFGHESGNRSVYVRLASPTVGSKFPFYGLFIGSTNTTLYWRGRTYEFTSNTTITGTSDYAQVDIKTSGNSISVTVQVYIDKVVGYK